MCLHRKGPHRRGGLWVKEAGGTHTVNYQRYWAQVDQIFTNTKEKDHQDSKNDRKPCRTEKRRKKTRKQRERERSIYEANTPKHHSTHHSEKERKKERLKKRVPAFSASSKLSSYPSWIFPFFQSLRQHQHSSFWLQYVRPAPVWVRFFRVMSDMCGENEWTGVKEHVTDTHLTHK